VVDWSPDDRLLVEDAIAGDDRAMARLLDRWLPIVLRWSNRLCGPKVDPEDAAHDAMIVVLRRLGDLRDPDAFPSWIYGIVRRTLAGHRRKAWVKRWVPSAVVEDRPDGGIGPDRQQELSELARDVQSALEELSPKLREILVLCEVEDLTDEEAAELLGIPVGTAKSRLRLARNKFAVVARRRHLDGEATDEFIRSSGGGR
jgi:RNA polymerase sigma factor (sigma-70 family)